VLHARTWAEIDLAALERNLAKVKALAGGADVMLVVKANAYGHGAVSVAWHLLGHGVASLGVGDSNEALELRRHGITSPIVILGAIVGGEMEDVIRGGISVTVHSLSRVRSLAAAAAAMRAVVKVHVKIDTGMGRLGCAPERAITLAREVVKSPHLELEGVATHLATPGPEGTKETERQLARFRRVLDVLETEGIRPRWRHALSSGGLLASPPGEFNLVRPGIAVYGLAPTSIPGDFEPALAWKTQIVFLRDRRRGARIGYGGTHRCAERSRIATLPVGYDDGYRFALSNKAHVLVRGQRAPVVGRVSMDYVMVDVTHVRGAAVDDEVTLVGRDGDEAISVLDHARWASTIPYEILCGIGERVARTYIRGRAPTKAEAKPLPEAKDVQVDGASVDGEQAEDDAA
jgi:alanine racemase